MGYSNVALKDKIMQMYPEISQNGISVGLDLNEEKDSYIIKFKKDSHELLTYLEKEDANECMDGNKCVHMGLKITEFINNFSA
jgi:hypothetical protein